MKVIDVYQRYFRADAVVNGVKRRAASVFLTATSEEGNIKYELSVSFFPYEEEGDFRVSYDACLSKELYFAKGRRSKKKEEEYLKLLRETADELAAGISGRIFWDEPLTDERRG